MNEDKKGRKLISLADDFLSCSVLSVLHQNSECCDDKGWNSNNSNVN